jgi:hypothetical protein
MLSRENALNSGSFRLQHGAQELLGALVLRAPKIFGRSLLGDPAAVEEADAVGELLGEAHLVGDHQHGQVVLGAEPRMTFSTSPTSSGSSAEVTSSNSMTLGRMASARAMATRCCWPPESCAG